jgi:hypothetical protein
MVDFSRLEKSAAACGNLGAFQAAGVRGEACALFLMRWYVCRLDMHYISLSASAALQLHNTLCLYRH